MMTRSSRIFPRAPRRQAGVAAVEFAIVVFVLLLIGAGIVEFGRTFWYYDAVAKGTRDAARYLSTVSAAGLSGAGTTATEIVVLAATAGGVTDFSSSNVTVSCAPTACGSALSPTDVTSVTVSAQYAMTIGEWFPFIASANAGNGGGNFAVTLSPHTTMPYMR